MNHKAHKAHEEFGADLEHVATQVVDAGLKIHRALGPGLLESAYERCLVHELTTRGLRVDRQALLPILYGGVEIDAGYRLDLLVEDCVIIEVKSIDALSRVHESQLMTYLKLSGRRLGFLMNFNVSMYKQGLRRIAL